MNFARAGVPFTRCLESPKSTRGVSALAGFPWNRLCPNWLRRGVRRCPRRWLASPGKGCCGREQELLGGRACQRRELHGKPSGEPAPVLSCIRKMGMKL